jgi:AAA family ATP:ADP antiporter
VLLFFVLAELGVEIGLPFYVWIGLVSVFLVAQFWSYATDLYTEEQGARLFAIIALGGSIGAVLGPALSRLTDTLGLLPLSALLLAGALMLFHGIERIHPVRDASAREAIRGAGGFELVVHDGYLVRIAGLVLVATLVNTTGEYVLSTVATEHAVQLVPASAHPELLGAARGIAIADDRREVIKAFYGDFFFWVNLVGFLLQAFVVSRAIALLGVRRALFVMPLLALGVYGAIAMVGGIALVRVGKIAENGTDYSLENTVRQLLYLPADRAVKYKAKTAIDTFVVRSGDTLAALLVSLGVHVVGFRGRGFAAVNVALVVLWLALAAGVVHHRRSQVWGGQAS